jgi:hypothetical protein
VEGFTASVFHIVKEIVSVWLCCLLFEEQLKNCIGCIYSVNTTNNWLQWFYYDIFWLTRVIVRLCSETFGSKLKLKNCSKKFYQNHLSLYILVQYCFCFAHVIHSWIVSFWFELIYILPSNNQNQTESKNLGMVSYKNPLWEYGWIFW